LPTPVDNSPGTSVPRLALRAPDGLDPELIFDSFVVGDSNRFAHDGCRAVAARPGGHYNPLLIQGGRGLGKTHLATAIGHVVRERSSSSRVIQLSADAFMRDLLRAIRFDQMESLRRRLRDVDLLIVDDVQFFAGRQRTQEEFFHTFNSLHDQNRQIVLTSDRPPKEIPRLEERLRNRFEWGLVVAIQPLDFATKLGLLQRDMTLRNLVLPDEVSEVLVEHAANARELAALVRRIRARAGVTGRRVTMDVAREVLDVLARSAEVSVESISRAVCERFAVRPSELRSRRRTRKVAVPRQLAMYLCRRLTRASYPQIGELFGRDHSTVMHATEATERRRKVDAAFHATVEELERRIRGD
jgi:chromosomal replication initiator protein